MNQTKILFIGMAFLVAIGNTTGHAQQPVLSEKTYTEEIGGATAPYGAPGVESNTMVTESISNYSSDPLDKKIGGPVAARNQDLQNIIQLVQQSSGMQFVIDEGVNKKVTFSLVSPTVRTLLDSVLPANGLAYRVMENGVVRIGLKEVIEKLPNRRNSQDDRYTLIRKSLMVMSNVLDYMLKEKLGEGYQSRSFFSKGTRGYWIPGSGVVFMLGVKFPLIQPDEVEPGKKEKRQNDLWDRFERKIGSDDQFDVQKNIVSIVEDRGRDDSNVVEFTNGEGGVEFDAKKIDAMRETVLEALAKYGRRFEGFTDNETITVIVEGEGNTGWGDFSGEPFNILYTDQSDSSKPFEEFHQLFYNDNKNTNETTSDKSDSSTVEKRSTIVVDGGGEKSSGRSKSDVRIVVPKPEPNVKPVADAYGTDDSLLKAQRERLQIDLKACEEDYMTRQKDMDAAQRELEIVQQQLETKKKMVETGRMPQDDLLEAEKQILNAQKFQNEAQRKLTEAQSKMKSLRSDLERVEKQKGEIEKAEQRYRMQLDTRLRDTQREKILQLRRNSFGRMGNDSSPVMAIQIRFGDLPKQEGTAKDIQDKVTITTY